jgi:hypothetical protein
MSIIHEALKKVQQGLAPEIETLSQEGQQTTSQESPIKNKIKSIFILSCAIVITGASIFYIYQHFQNGDPKIKIFAKKTFYKLIHKQEPLAVKVKAPEDLKPLAQFTIKPPAGSQITTPSAPITLNIHGIMANSTGNLVLINDQVYQEGDKVDGAKIVKINLDSITVINNGIKQTVLVKN